MNAGVIHAIIMLPVWKMLTSTRAIVSWGSQEYIVKQVCYKVYVHLDTFVIIMAYIHIWATGGGKFLKQYMLDLIERLL